MATQTITALVYQKKSKDRVNLFLDGEFAFGLALMLAGPLRVGQVLSDQEIAELRAADRREQAMAGVLHFLGYRARSEAEVRTYLAGKDCAETDIEEIVARLYRLGYLDDLAFARSWVASRNATRPKGLRALRYELQRKGISREIIQEVLAGFESDELAYAAVEKQAQRWRQLDARAFQRKVESFLARRGFGFDVIRRTVTRLQQVDPADDADTFES